MTFSMQNNNHSVITIIIFIIIITIVASSFSSAQTFLSQLEGEFFSAPPAATGRSGHGLSCTNAPSATSDPLVFIVGGFGESGPLSDTYSYNTVTQKWKRYELKNFNKNIVNFHLIAGEYDVDEPTLLQVGGNNFYTEAATSVVQAWESGFGNWETVSNPGFTVPTTYAGSFNMNKADNSYTGALGVYFVDGVSAGGVSSLIRHITFNAVDGPSTAKFIDDANTEWINGDDTGTAGTAQPHPTFGQCCARDPASATAEAWCFGGQSGSQGDTNELWKLDYRRQSDQGTQGDVWIKQSPTGTLPARRRFSSCAFVAADKMIVFGGFESSFGKPIDDKNVWILDVSTATPAWTSQAQDAAVDPVSSATNLMTTCYKNSAFAGTFMFGGAISNNNEFADDLYKFNTGTNKFEEATISGTDFTQPAVRPPGRQLHNSFTKSGVIYVLNGEGEDNLPRNDVWSFDTTSSGNSWVQIDIPTASKWTARKGAALVSAGGVSYFYGGIDSFGFYIADLVTVDPLQQKVTIYADSDVDSDANAPPFGRAYHVGIQIQNTIVFQGGKNSSAVTVPDFFAYSIITNTWTKLTPADDPDAYSNQAWIDLYARYGHVGLSFNNTHGIMGLGFGSGTAGTQLDFYWIKSLNTTGATFEIEQFPNSTALTSARDYVRGFAACVVVGQFIMCCGGRASAKVAPAVVNANCYSINTNDYQWNLVTNTGSTSIGDYLLSSPTLAYIRNTVYLVFGARGNGVTFSTTDFSDQLLRFVMTASKLCAPGSATNCIYCSDGYTQASSSCTVAPKGQYSENGASQPSSCPSGTFANTTGNSDIQDCIPCPFSTRNDQTGQASCQECAADEVCPVGSVTALSATSPRANLLSSNASRVISQSHPADYVDPKVSIFIVMLITSIVIVVLIVIAVIILIGSRAKRLRIAHFLGTEPRQTLEEIFEMYNKGRYGMTEDQFLDSLVREKQIFPPNTIDVDTAHKIYILVDTYKYGYLLSSQFLEAITVAIQYGYMDPFPGTDAVNDKKKYRKELLESTDDEKSSCCKVLDDLKLEDLDLYEEDHVTAEPGEPQKVLRAQYGGLLSLALIVAIVAVVMVVVLDFVLSSMTETKSLVPWPVITNEYRTAPGGTVVSTTIIAEIVVFGILRTGQGVASLKDACVKSDRPTTCASAAVDADGIYRGIAQDYTEENLGAILNCAWNDVQETCTVTWTCPDCGVSSSQQAEIAFTVSPALAATTIRGKLSIATGIRAATTEVVGTVNVAGGPNEFSTVQSFVSPTTNTEVLSGYPASAWNYQLSPTYFTAQQYAYLGGNKDAVYRDTGYHVHLPAAATPGSQVPPEIFGRTFDTPVEFKLSVDSIPTSINRFFFRSITEMFTSLAGAASGVAAVIVITIHVVDKIVAKKEQSEDPLITKEEADQKDEEMKTMPNLNQHNKDEATTTTSVVCDFEHRHEFKRRNGIDKKIFAKIKLLMDSGLTFRQAEAVLLSAQSSSSPSQQQQHTTLSNNESFDSSPLPARHQHQQAAKYNSKNNKNNDDDDNHEMNNNNNQSDPTNEQQQRRESTTSSEAGPINAFGEPSEVNVFWDNLGAAAEVSGTEKNKKKK